MAYKSIYTGAEMDQAIGRALPNGNIDTAISANTSSITSLEEAVEELSHRGGYDGSRKGELISYSDNTQMVEDTSKPYGYAFYRKCSIPLGTNANLIRLHSKDAFTKNGDPNFDKTFIIDMVKQSDGSYSMDGWIGNLYTKLVGNTTTQLEHFHIDNVNTKNDVFMGYQTGGFVVGQTTTTNFNSTFRVGLFKVENNNLTFVIQHATIAQYTNIDMKVEVLA